MISSPIVKFVLTAALRDKLIITFLLLLVLITSISIFLGSATITEEDQFAMVYTAGGMRFLGVLCVILFSCFYVRRAFDSKEVEFMLSKPVSRLNYVLSHATAFVILSVLIALIISAIVYITGQPDVTGWLVWGLSLCIEFTLVSIIALFFSMVLSSAAGSALACFAVYALARMIGVILAISILPADSTINMILAHVMEFVSIFIPRLDLMGNTSWLVYGSEMLQNYEADRFAEGWSRDMVQSISVPWFIVIQGAVFSVFLLTCTVFDFVRKQF